MYWRYTNDVLVYRQESILKNEKSSNFNSIAH